jgi:hypothetical protein
MVSLKHTCLKHKERGDEALRSHRFARGGHVLCPRRGEEMKWDCPRETVSRMIIREISVSERKLSLPHVLATAKCFLCAVRPGRAPHALYPGPNHNPRNPILYHI